MTYPRLAVVAALMLTSATLVARQGTLGQLPGQVRQDGQQTQEPRGAIWGTVVSGKTGQPVDRVRLRLSGEGIRGTRTVYSDDDGRYAFMDLPAGAYTLSGSKTGYVSITYGQRSPNAGRPGTPIQLAEGQQIKDLVFELPPGGVITGIVFDEKNRPSVATPVRVMRWSMSNGERTLSSAGTSTTDDRGIYRVYGLPPGEYVVSALPRNTGVEQSAEMQLILEERMVELQARDMSSGGFVVSGGALSVELGAGGESEAATIGYAPIFYPGTLDLGTAMPVTVGVSQELSSVDFALQQVALARVGGSVIVPPGMNTSSIQVRLYNSADRIPGVNTQSSRVRNNEFSFNNVPPGQYRAVATANVRNGRGGRGGDEARAAAPGTWVNASSTPDVDRLWASTDIAVSGRDVSNVALVLQPGMTVSGSIAYEGAATPPEARRIRVTLAPFGPEATAAGASSRNATVDESGRFDITGVVPGRYHVRATGVPGWSVKSAVHGGLETLDFALDVTPMEHVDNLRVVFSDQSTELSGVLQDPLGSPTADYTVIVFPSDQRYWLPQARRIQATRPSTAGRFAFSGLPPGDYRLAAVTDVETGIWYDPAFLEQLAGASVPFTLQPGQSATQNFRVGR
jgi:uncharacterized protein (DUF2141 family)